MVFLYSFYRLSPKAITAFSTLQHPLKITCEVLHIFHALIKIISPSLSGCELSQALNHNSQAAGAAVSQHSWSSNSNLVLSIHTRDLISLCTLSNCPHKYLLMYYGRRRKGRRGKEGRQGRGLLPAVITNWRQDTASGCTLDLQVKYSQYGAVSLKTWHHTMSH